MRKFVYSKLEIKSFDFGSSTGKLEKLLKKKKNGHVSLPHLFWKNQASSTSDDIVTFQRLHHARWLAINEPDKLHKFEREKEKATSFQHPHFDGGRLIDRKNRSASSCYSSPLRGKEHICSPRLSFAHGSHRNRLLKVPPSFSRTALFLVCGNNTHGEREYRRIKSYVGHTQSVLMPVWRHSLTNRSTCLEGEGEQNGKIEREREILFIEFEHEKHDEISKSLLIRRPHLDSRVIVTFNLFTIAWIEYVDEKKYKGCLFI